ncbi:MAG: metallophosphoesterase, partial [Actinoallomurus sp.]
MKKTKPEKLVDQFLAAPDTLRRSSAELQKARDRKAREEAERRRLLASKSKREPSVEDLIADVVRVAGDAETNPFSKFKSVSRDRYAMYGHFPVAFVDQQFGTFQHFKEVAGLADQPGDRLFRANRASESRRAHAQRYFERWVRPCVATAADRRKMSGRDYLLLSISDTHAQFLCPFVWTAFLQAVKDLRPDGVLFNGDTLETVELSRHPKIPGWSEPLQSELDFKREMFRQVREVAGHQGDVFDTGGNHDLTDRLCAYFTQSDSALVGLRSMRVDQLYGLQEFGVKLLHGGSI